MLFEIKRILTPYNALIITVNYIVLFILAFVLVMALDKVEVTYLIYSESLVTTFSQLSFLLLSFVMSNYFMVDITHKSTYFYRENKFVLFHKYVSFLSLSSVVIVILNLLISLLLTGSLNLILIFYLLNINVFITSIVACINFIFLKPLSAAPFAILVWLSTVVLINIDESLNFLNPYDQSQQYGMKIQELILSNQIEDGYLYYSIFIIMITSIIAVMSFRRWFYKNM